jgi:hypothetical protein
LTLAAGTATASAPVIDGSQTWNNVAVTFTGYKLNITDTASASTSLLADLQVGGSSKFSVGKDGTITMPNAATITGAGGLEFRYNAGSQLIIRSGPTTEIVRFSSTDGMQFLNGGYIQMKEQTAPTAPSANNVRIYAQDNGAGKTQLMALFATGAAQQIAIEP